MVNKSLVYQFAEAFSQNNKKGDGSVIFGVARVFCRFWNANHDALLESRGVVSCGQAVVIKFGNNYK